MFKDTQSSQFYSVLLLSHLKTCLACTIYFGSQSMHSLKVENLGDVLNEALKVLPKKNWMNLSMDDSSINWVVLKSIQKQCKELEAPALVNLQSFGLHIISVASQTGILKTCWELDKVRLVKKMVCCVNCLQFLLF